MHSPTALTTTAVRASVLAVLSLNAVTRVVESVSFCTQALVTPLGVIADLLTVVRLLRALVDVSTGAEITGEPVASGAGALVAACCVVASRLTVVQTPVLTLVNVHALVAMAYRESEDGVMTRFKQYRTARRPLLLKYNKMVQTHQFSQCYHTPG